MINNNEINDSDTDSFNSFSDESQNNELEIQEEYYIDDFDKFINKGKIIIKNNSEINDLHIYDIGTSILKKDLNKIIIENGIININICGYIINKNLKKPFLEYLLYKNEMNLLQFPEFKFNMKKKLDIEKYSIIELKKIIHNLNPYIKIINELNYKGYLFYKDEIYVFIDMSEIDLINYRKVEKDEKENIFFVLIDEIINYRKTYDIFISSKVIYFFNENNDFIFIYDVYNKIIDTPIVCYLDKYDTDIEFTLNFGLMKQSRESIVGPYYYFTSYDGVKDEMKKSLKNRKGIIRYVVFQEKMKVMMNYPGDDIDESMYKKELLLKNINNNYDEKLTMRLSDYGCKWIKKYDTLFIGIIDLDNGKKLFNYPLWVVKNNNQFLNLSYKIYI